VVRDFVGKGEAFTRVASRLAECIIEILVDIYGALCYGVHGWH